MLTEASRVRDRSWVIQCALSRICGGCAMSLGRPIAFLGDASEVRRGVFHLPPMHVECAEELRAGTSMELVTTPAFEFVRPGREMLYSPLDNETRYKAKSVTDVPVYRGADALAAQVSNAIASAGISASAVAMLGALVAAAWGAVGWWLGKRLESGRVR